MNKKALDPISNLLVLQGNLSKTLTFSVQKIMKDHALVHEECLKDFEKLKKINEEAFVAKRTSEIKEKMLYTNQNTEHLVLASLAENSNQEAGYLQTVKLSMINIYSLEDTLNSSISAIIDFSYKNVLDIDVSDDFKDMQVYVRKALPMISSFGENSHTIESFEGDDDCESLNNDNILQKFGLKSSTSMIENFSCALYQKLLLHGRMYLTTTHICFQSYFNSTTIFGRETLISIPLSDIKRIEKRTSALIFDNALCISTNSSNFVFTSFLYREQAFATLENLLKITILVEKISYVDCKFEIETRKHRKDLQKLFFFVKPSLSPSISSAILKTNILDPLFRIPFPPNSVFSSFFSDEACDFLTKYLSTQGNTDIQISK